MVGPRCCAAGRAAASSLPVKLRYYPSISRIASTGRFLYRFRQLWFIKLPSRAACPRVASRKSPLNCTSTPKPSFPTAITSPRFPIDELEARRNQPDGRLILVTAMTPTPQGEGKTTTTIGLADALRRLGRKSMFCLREPSLGPYFGIKGGGTGGGRAQVVPAEDINLHFVGDMYAVEKANNLLCRHGGQPPPARQRARPRPAPHRPAPRHRPQRPLVARHHHRPGRPASTACRAATASTSRRPPK